MSTPTNNWQELDRLIDGACDRTLSADEWIELGQWLTRDREACERYAACAELHATLAWQIMPNARLSSADLQRYTEAERDSSGVEGHCLPDALSLKPITLATTLQGTTGYFSSGWPVAYLVATVIFGLGLLVGGITHVSSPLQVVRHVDSVRTSNPQSLIPNPSPEASFVGRITGMVDCEWADDSAVAFNGANVPLGRKYVLSSGLMELTYDTGAKVILQGPCTYEVESAASGYLSIGKLTARVEKKVERGEGETVRSTEYGVQGGVGRGTWDESSIQHSSLNLPSLIPDPSLSTLHSPLFTIKTPTATVTDLGTEFGVEVSKEGNTTSHVFRGSVELRTTSPGKNSESIARVLQANESACVENQGSPEGSDLAIVSVPAAGQSTFAREIPKRTPDHTTTFDLIAYWQFDGDGFLADSSGNGHTLVNQGATQRDETASFNGKAAMRTVDSIDLSRYRKIRVSWSQTVASLAPNRIIWEQSSDYNSTNGAIVAYLNEGVGHAGITATSDKGLYNVDQFPVATNKWEHFTVEFDRTAPRPGVVKVFKDGRGTPAVTMWDGFAPESFVNAPFYIGARDGMVYPLIGQIDNLKIEARSRDTEEKDHVRLEKEMCPTHETTNTTDHVAQTVVGLGSRRLDRQERIIP